MKNSIVTILAAMSAMMFASCAKDSGGNGEPSALPEISIEIKEQTPEYVRFTILAENAVEAAYMFESVGDDGQKVALASESGIDGEHILKSGEALVPGKKMEFEKKTEKGTDYDLMAAAVNADGKYTVERKQIKAMSPEEETEEYTEASVVYKDNGAVVFTLSGFEDKVISGVEVMCLKDNSRKPSEGSWPLVSDALCGSVRIPAGSMLEIDAAENVYSLTLVYSDGERQIRSMFSGDVSGIMDFKETSARMKFAAALPEWTTEQELSVMLTESEVLEGKPAEGEGISLSKLRLVFDCPDHLLVPGEYVIGEKLKSVEAEFSPYAVRIGFKSGKVTVSESDGVFGFEAELSGSYDAGYAEEGLDFTYGGQLSFSYEGQLEGVSASDPRNGTIYTSGTVVQIGGYLCIDMFPDDMEKDYSLRLKCEFLSETPAFNEGNYQFSVNYGCYVFRGKDPTDIYQDQFALMGTSVEISYGDKGWLIHTTGEYMNTNDYKTYPFEGWYEGPFPELDPFRPTE